jgi:hypothetical protein
MPIFRSPLSVDSHEAIFVRSRRRSSAGQAAQPHYAAAPWPDIAPDVVGQSRRHTSELSPCAQKGTVTLPNRARNKSAGMLGSRRSDDVAPRLHRRGPEGSVRFCGGEMALDVESVVSGCVG